MADPWVLEGGGAQGERPITTGDHEAPGDLTRAGLELLAVSFVVLFQELALIRWLPSQVRVVAYFPNLILISAFLGLGVGCLRAKRPSMLWMWAPSLLVIVGVSTLLSRVAFTANSISEHLWLLYYDLPDDAPVVQGVRAPILVSFILSAASFVPLGQLVAQRIQRFQERSSALWGYSLDLAGSLLGVIGFAVVSFLRTFPIFWFATFLAIGSTLFLGTRRGWRLHVVAAVMVLAVVLGSESAHHYSPYYAISTRSIDGSTDHHIMTNGSLHQIARSLRRSDPVLSDEDLQNRTGYHYPYDQLLRRPERALVLGAGTGNDVAVLLDQGVEEIDVVEIDPVILELGRSLHPNQPYASERVHLINTDARSFLNDTDRTYDLIVFGTLDSMTRLSALSNVRLDNFVYTVEGLRAARARLAPDGGLVMYFTVGKEHIHEHLFGMLAEVFGDLPTVQWGDYILFNAIYMAGPAFAHLDGFSERQRTDYFERVLPAVDLPTDDWPYLYLESRSVNSFYLSLMAVLIALAVAAVLWASREMRRSVLGLRSVDLEMFLFGLAFLLLETRFVTAINLVWGATWLTSAVVFGAILAMVLAATVMTEIRPLPWHAAASGLVASLLLVYLTPVDLLVGRAVPVRLALSVLFVGSPVFFASVCFALRFKIRTSADLAFGWNLLGAVAGGLIEFFSMSLGLRALLLVATVAYMGTFLLREREHAAARQRVIVAEEALA